MPLSDGRGVFQGVLLSDGWGVSPKGTFKFPHYILDKFVICNGHNLEYFSSLKVYMLL